MIKFLKRLFVFCFLLTLIGGVWGYYQGLRPANYKEYFSDFITKHSSKSNVPAPENKQNVIPKKEEYTKDGSLALPINPYAKIDSYARNCPASVETDVNTLAVYLQQGTTSDLEKVRSIYIWITDNILYNDKEYNTGFIGNYSAEEILASREAVCDGFSELFLALGQAMELEIKKIIGYAKGYGYSEKMKFNETNHAWNIVKIDGNWRVFDSTWGQGYGTNINGRLVSKKKFNDYWFNVDPYEAIFNHLPADDKLAFVQPAISLSIYEQLPEIDYDYFKLGFSGKETYKKVVSEINTQFPECLNAGTFIKMNVAPEYKVLHHNEVYKFEFFIPKGLSVAIIDSNDNWMFFDKNKGKFKLEYTPQTDGELQISVKYDKGGRSYHTFMIYSVGQYKEVI